MKSLARRRPSPAMAVSLVALFVSLGGVAWALQANSVKSRHIVNGQVKNKDLRDDGVDAEKIAAGAVDSSEIAAGAVDSSEIADGAVGSSEIADGAVGSAQIADGSVAYSDLAGAARGARAYGRVSGGGVLNETKNVDSLTNPATGVWCITPAAGAGIDVAGGQIVATIDNRGATTTTSQERMAHIEWMSDEAINTCPDTAFQVQTYELDLDTPATPDLKALNQGFSFVIP